MPRIHRGQLNGSGLRVAIAVSRFSGEPSEKLLEGALGKLTQLDVADGDIDVAWVPGAYELPQVARRFVEGGRHDCVVCLGCVIRGETAHFDFVAGGAAAGIAAIQRESKIPVIFGVLTTDDRKQALDRCGGSRGNRGADAAEAAIEMSRLLKDLDEEKKGN